MRFARILKPKILFLENVKGLVNHDKGKTLDVIVETLNESGYTVDFEVLNSKFFGVPQNRERIFIIAVRDDLIEGGPWIIEGNTVVPKGKRRIGAYEGVKTFNFDWPKQDDVSVRLRDILEITVDEKYYLRDEKTAALIAQLEGTNKDPVLIDLSQAKREGKPQVYYDVAPTLTSRDYKGPKMVGRVDIKGTDSIKRVYSPEGVCPTLTTMGGGHQEPKIAERQTIPESLGIESGITEETQGQVQGQDKNRRYRIRKLSPNECWRLQGYPDSAFEKALEVNSDSQLYKQSGNSVTVNVIEELAKRFRSL